MPRLKVTMHDFPVRAGGTYLYCTAGECKYKTKLGAKRFRRHWRHRHGY